MGLFFYCSIICQCFSISRRLLWSFIVSSKHPVWGIRNL